MDEEYNVNENEEVNETAEDSEFDSVDSSEGYPYIDSCTLVYTENFEYVCAEDLLIAQYPALEDLTAEEMTEENIVQVELAKTEKDLEYQEQLLTSLNEISEQQEKLLQSSDASAALEVYEQINDRLDDIYEYVSIGIVLYIIAWVISVVNSYRRNIK